MNQRILELAKECEVFPYVTVGNQRECFTFDNFQLEAFYQLAHQDGQKQMRERAAKECEDQGYDPVIENGCAKAIRNLEITNE